MFRKKNDDRKFIEDEFKPKTESRFKKQLVKMKSKTKELWQKISKCIEIDPEFASEEYEEDNQIDVPVEIKKI